MPIRECEVNMNEGLEQCLRRLFVLVGHKRYFNEIEEVLRRIGDLSPAEDESFLMLARNLRDVHEKANRADKPKFLPF